MQRSLQPAQGPRGGSPDGRSRVWCAGRQRDGRPRGPGGAGTGAGTGAFATGCTETPPLVSASKTALGIKRMGSSGAKLENNRMLIYATTEGFSCIIGSYSKNNNKKKNVVIIIIIKAASFLIFQKNETSANNLEAQRTPQVNSQQQFMKAPRTSHDER